MSVTLLSPSLARLDRRDAISVDVDPKAKLLPSLPLHSEQRLRSRAEKCRYFRFIGEERDNKSFSRFSSRHEERRGRRRFVTPLNNVLHLASRSGEFRDLLAA